MNTKEKEQVGGILDALGVSFMEMVNARESLKSMHRAVEQDQMEAGLKRYERGMEHLDKSGSKLQEQIEELAKALGVPNPFEITEEEEEPTEKPTEEAA